MTTAKNRPEGFCTQCNKRPVKPGRKRCVTCLAHASRYHAKRVAEALKSGLCTKCCERKVRKGKKLCAACAAKTRAYVTKHRTEGNALLACYVSTEMAHAVKAAAQAKGQSVSEWLRGEIERALSQPTSISGGCPVSVRRPASAGSSARPASSSS
jgi:hypothetical protein